MYLYIYIYIYIFLYVSVVGTLWLIISTRSEFSSPLHRSPILSPTLCVFYIFDLLQPLSLSLSPPPLSLLSGFLPRTFVQIARDALRIRPGIAREMFNVLSISVTGIPHEHAYVIDRQAYNEPAPGGAILSLLENMSLFYVREISLASSLECRPIRE